MITIAAGASGIVVDRPPLEGDNAWFTLSRTGSVATAALTVNVTVSETGGDRVAAANEGAKTVTFTIRAERHGASSTPRYRPTTSRIFVATVDDSVDQANSTVTMTVTSGYGEPFSHLHGGNAGLGDGDGSG